MIRYAAINTDTSGETDSEKETGEQSIEALEAAIFRTYEKALRAQQKENYLQAQQLYHDILHSPILDHERASMQFLKYTTLKNLATISELVDDRERALSFYTRAVDIDGNDLLMWYHIGRIAGELQRWNISRLAFERALQLQPNHWMSIERLSELLFIIGDTDSCLKIVKRARTIDPFHSRLALLEFLLELELHQQQSDNNSNNSNNINSKIMNNQQAKLYLSKLIAKREKTCNLNKESTTSSVTSDLFNQIVSSTNQYTLAKLSWESLYNLLLSIYKEKSNEDIVLDDSSNSIDNSNGNNNNQFQLYKPLKIDFEQKLLSNLITTNNDNNVDSPNNQNNEIVDAVNELEKKQKEQDTQMVDIEKSNQEESSTTSIATPITTNDDKTQQPPNDLANKVEENTSTSNSLNSSSGNISTTSQVIGKRRSERLARGAKHDDKNQEIEDFGEKILKSNKLMLPEVMNSLFFMSDENTSPKQLQQQQQQQIQHDKLLKQQTTQMDIETSQSFEKNYIYKYISSINQLDSKYTIIDWLISFLNNITLTYQQQHQFDSSLINKLQNLSSIVSKHNNQFQSYILFFAELSLDNIFTKLESDSNGGISADGGRSSKRQRKEDNSSSSSDLSYMIQLLNSQYDSFKDDTYYCIRYNWLLARYTKYLGDIHLATVYFTRCDELFTQWIQHNPSALIILYHCKNDKFISKSALSERIENLQDQQEKNNASLFFSNGEFGKVINLLDPQFPDAFCLVDPTQLEFKSRDIIDSKTRSRLNMIDLLLQSYFKTLNTKGVFKMSIYLLKELALNYNENIVTSTFETLDKVFSDISLKPDYLNEPLSTLSSILSRLMYKHHKKNLSYSWLNLFIKIYTFDLNTPLTISNKLALFSGYHYELGKKKQCRSNDQFLFDYLECGLRFIISQDTEINPSDFSGNKLEFKISKIITDISQCFNCLYSIKLTTGIEDHQCQSEPLALESPNVYVQIYYLIKILTGEEEDINLSLNKQVLDSIDFLRSIGNRREFKELTEKIYLKFPEPPERITKYRKVIDDYFSGKTDSIQDSLDISSPPRINFEQLFNRDKNLSLTDPLFDDIYTDIYYMYATSLPHDDILFKEELIKKDLYSNPKRIASWKLLSREFQSEVTNTTSNQGCMCHIPEIQQEIWSLYGKLRILYRHLATIEKTEDTYKFLGLMAYEQHYFVNEEFASNPDNISSLYKESLSYFKEAEKLCTSELWYFPLYYGKISYKLKESPELYLNHLWESIELLPPLSKKNTPINPIYRLHTYRLKLLLPYSSTSLNENLLSLLEKFNYIAKTTTTTTSTTNNGNNNNENQPKEIEEETSQQNEPLSLEVRRENLIDNSMAALNFCKSILSYHHQSSYRIAWTIRYQTTKEDYIANSLREFIKMMKPKLSRLSRGAIYSLWNEGYIGDGKIDRYIKKYHRFFIELLLENDDYTNLDIVHSKLKQEEKYKSEATICFGACFIALQNHLQQIELSETTTTTTTAETTLESESPKPSEETKQSKLLQNLWELYTDISLYPEFKERLYDLMRKAYHLSTVINQENNNDEKMIEFYEKKFSLKDKRKKK